MKKNTKKIEDATKVLLNFRFFDKEDDELLSSIIKLRTTIGEFFNVFRFPHGTGKLLLGEDNKNTKSKKEFYRDIKQNDKKNMPNL